jgi:cysteine-S-conjugate beta-lyase
MSFDPSKAAARHVFMDANGFASLVPPVWRASTVVFDSLDAFVARKHRLPDGFTYGTTGTPTQRALEQRIAALDHAAHCVVLPSGQAAICNTLLALLRQGDHLLMTESAYRPAKTFAEQRLASLGVEVEFYPPRIGAGIESLLRPRTRMVWLESPGSLTMEMQDVPAIARVARRHQVLTAIDNTWASPLGFTPLAHGVDLCIHACTKYLGGHSDVLMGSVSMRDEKLYRELRTLQAVMGQAVSAEDCFLVARGLETLEVRLERQARSAHAIAQRLSTHRFVRRTLFPPLASDRDHALWREHYRGGGVVLGLELADAPRAAFAAMFAELKHFSIGASWGGVHSVAGFYPAEEFAGRRHCDLRGPMVRLSIGLEPVEALIDELDAALAAFGRHLNR